MRYEKKLLFFQVLKCLKLIQIIIFDYLVKEKNINIKNRLFVIIRKSL